MPFWNFCPELQQTDQSILVLCAFACRHKMSNIPMKNLQVIQPLEIGIGHIRSIWPSREGSTSHLLSRHLWGQRILLKGDQWKTGHCISRSSSIRKIQIINFKKNLTMGLNSCQYCPNKDKKQGTAYFYSLNAIPFCSACKSAIPNCRFWLWLVLYKVQLASFACFLAS